MEELTQRIEYLEGIILALQNNATIPLEFGNAMKQRLGGVLLTPSNVSASAHNKAVNESGSSSYSVMNVPTGFVQTTINGQVVVIPYF